MMLASRSLALRSLARAVPCLVAAAIGLVAAPAHAGPPAPGAIRSVALWSTPGGDAQPVALALDLAGNQLVTGSFTETIDFGNGPLVSAGGAGPSSDIFVVKLDAHGVAQWSKRFGDAADSHYAYAVATDLAGDVYVAGVFSGTIDFGGGPLTATVDVPAPPPGYSAGSDAFLVKLDRNGNHVWSKRLGGQGLQQAYALGVDLAGSVTVGGAFAGVADFGGGPRACVGECSVLDGSTNGFVATYDASGHHVSDTELSSDPAGSNAVGALAVDLVGTVTVAGKFVGTLDVGAQALEGSASAPSVFVAQLARSGGARWIHGYGASFADSPSGVAVDLEGGAVVYGTFSDTIDFGGGPLTAAATPFGAGPSLFLAHLDDEGEHVWSKAFGTTGIVTSGNVAVDLEGDVAITGGYAGSIDFGGGPVAGGLFFPAAFVAAFDRTGAAKWSHTASSDGDAFSISTGVGAAFDLGGNLSVAGGVSGTLDFGGGALGTGADFTTFGVFAARFRP